MAPGIFKSWDLQHELQENAKSNLPCQWEGPRRKISEWAKLGANQVPLQAISHGVKSPMDRIPQPQLPRKTPTVFVESLTKTIGEYCTEQALRRLSPAETARTKFWIQIFGRPKKDSPKVRLITDLRPVNVCHTTPKHKADTWADVLRVLENPKNRWGITLDLKSWYHHLQVHPKTQRWMRFLHQGVGYQVQAIPFGCFINPFGDIKNSPNRSKLG